MQLYLKTPTPNLERSLAYWQRLGFAPLDSERHLVSDGRVILEVDTTKTARPGIVLRRESWTDFLPTLEPFGPLHGLEPGSPESKSLAGTLIAAPSGTWVYLMEGPAIEGTPDDAEPVLGNFAGISLESTRMADSREFWETLGFSLAQGDESKGYMVLTNQAGDSVSVMRPFSCPHLFFNPGMTYFNSGKNPEIIAELRKRGVEFAEEVTVFNESGNVDNIILRDPGGLSAFIFND